jgi:hypothetical protein
MTYMRWKSLRLTSHTWLGLNPQIGRPLSRIVVPLVYFIFLLTARPGLENSSSLEPYSQTEADWDQKASATFHTKKSKTPLFEILYERLKRPLRPKSHYHFGQSVPAQKQPAITKPARALGDKKAHFLASQTFQLYDK